MRKEEKGENNKHGSILGGNKKQHNEGDRFNSGEENLCAPVIACLLQERKRFRAADDGDEFLHA